MVIETGLAWMALMTGVVLGGKNSGRRYGVMLSLLCTLLWLLFAVVQVPSALTVMDLVLYVVGAQLLLLGGVWASGSEGSAAALPSAPVRRHRLEAPEVAIEQQRRLVLLSELPNRFSAWLDQYRQHIDPWPAFDGHIRSVLSQVCGAGQVQIYRVLDDNQLLMPLVEVRPEHMSACLAAGEGVAGWVVHTAQVYHSSVPVLDAELRNIVARTQPAVTWCFPVVIGGLVVGVVAVGSLDGRARKDMNLLRLVAGMMTEQWNCVAEICRARVATVTDSASGLMTRSQFLRQAPLVVERSQRQSQAVTAAAFAIEGLQELDDAGYWGLRDMAVASVGRALRRRVTPEDCVGRFDDRRFVMVWQSPDPTKAQNDIAEIVADLQREFEDQAKWRRRLKIRAGLASSRNGSGSLQGLLAVAFRETEGSSELRIDVTAGATI